MLMMLIFSFWIGSWFSCQEGFEKLYLLHFVAIKYNLERNQVVFKGDGSSPYFLQVCTQMLILIPLHSVDLYVPVPQGL